MAHILRLAVIVLAAVVLLSASVRAPAAAIVWEPVQSTSGPGDILTTGTVVEAVNARNSNSGFVTVNGVTFRNSNALLSQNGGNDMLAGNSTGDTDMDTFLNRLDYGGGTSTSVNIGGGLLTVGNPYQVQVFFTDLRGCCNGRTMTFGDSQPTESTVDVHASQGGFGQYGVGTFTADASSQDLTLVTNGFGNAHITGYQIRDLTPAPITANLQANWKLDETGGTAAVDSADGHDGTITNAIVDQPGIVGNNRAYEFRGAGGSNNGSNDRVVVDDGFFLDDYNRLTITAWINPDTLDGQVGHGGANGATGRAIIEGKGNRDALAFQVGDEDDIYGFLRFGDNSGTTLELRTNDGPVVTGEWQHVAMTYSAKPDTGGVMQLFVNGQQVAQGSHNNANNTIDVNDTVDNLLLGVYSGNAAGSSGIRNRFDGLMDDLGLWGGTNSEYIPGPVEIAAIHAMGRFEGLTLDDPQLDEFLVAFNAGEGNSAMVGDGTWMYSANLSAGSDLGAFGGDGGPGSFVVLDDAGNGMILAAVPEPSTLALAALALMGLAMAGRRRRG